MTLDRTARLLFRIARQVGVAGRASCHGSVARCQAVRCRKGNALRVDQPTSALSIASGGASGRPLRVGLLGMFGNGNFGNDGSLAGMLLLLRRDRPADRLVVFCTEPDAVAAAYGVEARPLRAVLPAGRIWRTADRALLSLPSKILGWAQAFNATRNLDVLLVPGTGILDDCGTGPQGMPYGLYRWFRSARLNGVNTAFVSIGAGPIHNRISRWLMTGAAAATDYRSYRERPAHEFMTRLGFDTRYDPVYPDLAFALDPPLTQAHREGPLVVGLGIMAYRGWSGHEVKGRQQFDRYVERTARLLSALIAQGYKVEILIGEAGDEKGVEAVLTRAASLIADEDMQRVAWQPQTSLEDVVRTASQADVVIASRFHNVVGALIAGTPAISLGYAVKNRAVLETFGLGDYCHEIETFEIEPVLRQVEQIASRRDVLSEAIRRKLGDVRRELDAQQADLILRLMRRRRPLRQRLRWPTSGARHAGSSLRWGRS